MESTSRRSWLSVVFSGLVIALTLASARATSAQNNINLIPTISNISVVNGQLVASGTATATLNGQTYTRNFSGVPVNLALAPDQTGAGACPILDLSLAPIDLNLLGLVVQTSPICLDITAHQNAGLLGDLLCSVANALNGGLSLDQILAGLAPGITGTDVTNLLTGLTDVLNQALGSLLGSTLTDIIPFAHGANCSILHLELGPLDLNLLGLEVTLDNCAGGNVTVDIKGQTGRNKLLGNLLCGLLGNGGLNLGTTLGELLNQLGL
jgi:hypothetical protein